MSEWIANLIDGMNGEIHLNGQSIAMKEWIQWLIVATSGIISNVYRVRAFVFGKIRSIPLVDRVSTKSKTKETARICLCSVAYSLNACKLMARRLDVP